MSNIATPASVQGNLVWREDGTIVAVFRAPLNTARFGPVNRRLDAVDTWARVLSKLPDRWVHTTLDAEMTGDMIRRRMASAVGGLDRLFAYPAYARSVQDTLDYLGEQIIPERGLPHERFSFLYVDMPHPQIRQTGARIRQSFATFIGAPPATPKGPELDKAAKWANELAGDLARIDSGFEPATPDDLVWLYEYAATKGGAETPYPYPDLSEPMVGGATLIPFPDPPTRLPGTLARSTRTLDYSTDARINQTSYTTTLILNKLPRTWLYPDRCLRDRLDDLPFPVQTTLIGQPPMTSAQLSSALSASNRANRSTADDSAEDANRHIDLENSRESVTYLEQIAAARDRTYPTTTLVSLAAPTIAELDNRVRQVADALSATGVHDSRLLTRLKDQVDLYTALLPGGIPTSNVAAYARPGLSARDVARLGNHHGWEFGDGRGRVYGYRADTAGVLRLIFRDPSKGPARTDGGSSATSGHIGTPGAGKTMELKEDARQVNDMGGRVFAWDRSPEKEWARVASTWSGSVSIISPSGNTISDPLRILLGTDVFRGDTEEYDLALNICTSWLALNLGITRQGDEYDTILSALMALVDPASTLAPSLPNLHRVLKIRANLVNDYESSELLYPARTDLARAKAETLASRLIAQARISGNYEGQFGDRGHLPNFDVDALVYCSPVEVPDRESLALYGDSLPPQILAAQAEIFYIAALGLAYVNHAKRRRFSLMCINELSDVAASPWGPQLLDNMFRKLRRANGGASTDSQLASHYTSIPGKAGAMVRYRTAGKCEDKDGAEDALRWLDIEPSPDLVRLLLTASAGQKLARDPKGATAWVHLLEPPNEATWLLTRTDPGSDEDRRSYFGDANGPTDLPETDAIPSGATA